MQKAKKKDIGHPFNPLDVCQKMKQTLRKAFAVVLTASVFVGMIPSADATDYAGYSALDSKPAQFRLTAKRSNGNGKNFVLDENTLFLDYRLKREQLATNPYAFNNLKDAAAKLRHGTAEKPMMLLTAPGVYWVDDPDDPAITALAAAMAVGLTDMVIACNHLCFYGLNSKRENVVFAVNRSQGLAGFGGQLYDVQYSGHGPEIRKRHVRQLNCNVDPEIAAESVG